MGVDQKGSDQGQTPFGPFWPSVERLRCNAHAEAVERRGIQMKTTWLVACVLVALAGCGGGSSGGETWVDTGSGDCQESQLAEARQNQEMFNMIGTGACTKHGMG